MNCPDRYRSVTWLLPRNVTMSFESLEDDEHFFMKQYFCPICLMRVDGFRLRKVPGKLRLQVMRFCLQDGEVKPRIEKVEY